MRSLVFGSSLAKAQSHRPSVSALPLCTLGCGLALIMAAVGCGSDAKNGGSGTVALADSGSLIGLTAPGAIDIPATVAVRDGVAWVTETQFDHYLPFMGDGMPAKFRLVGLPLAGGQAQEIPLPDEFFPEGITVTGADRMFVGSVATGAIYTVPPNQEVAEEFVPAKTLPQSGVLGLTPSADGGLLWACNTDTANAHADIVGIGVADGEIKAKHHMPDSAVGSFCNDLALSANGTLWATESFGGRLFRIPSGQLLSNSDATEWLQSPLLTGPDGPTVGVFGVNGLSLVSGKLLLVNSSLGTLLSIDPTLASPTSDDLHTIALTAGGGNVVLANPDGITRVNDTEVLIVENGLGLPNGKRVVRVDLNTL
jgi:hypothetical protein